MLDKHILPGLHRLYQPLVRWLLNQSISANQLSVVGFCMGMLGVIALIYQQYWLGLVFILVNRILDGLDGQVARQSNTSSDAGAFLDICLDFIFYQAVMLGFVLSDPEFVVWGVLMMLSFSATATSFLAFAIFAQKHSLSSLDYPNKGIYYMSGLAEGTETIVYFCLICLWPEWFTIISMLFFSICVATAIIRIVLGFRQLQQL